MAAQGSPGVVRAVLLDALGTLLELLPPVPRLRAALAERAGVVVDEALAARAIAAEIRFYRAHLFEGGTPAGLAALRERCAAVVAAELGAAGRGVPAAAILDALLAALEFRAYPDAAPALRALRARGVRLVVVSNWDLSLHERLAQTGLAPLLDGAVASAEAGAAKPDAAIFRRALALAGDIAPAQALHVGDTPGADVAGARAAGVRPVLIVRGGGAPAIQADPPSAGGAGVVGPDPPRVGAAAVRSDAAGTGEAVGMPPEASERGGPGVPTIASLGELVALVG